METKEIKINIPRGYEIDKENSTFECIKFKPSKKYFTYKDICAKLFKEEGPGYYVASDGNIQKTQLEAFRQFITAPNNAPSKKQLERLLALNQLMNIAYYYNNCKYIEKGHMISYNKEQECYEVISVGNTYYKLTAMDPVFKRTEDAQAVIDNPNFREILDTLCK